jgi:hypothetical protein
MGNAVAGLFVLIAGGLVGWGWKNRHSWLGRTAAFIGLAGIYALLTRFFFGRILLPSLGFVLSSVPVWKPLLIGVVLGLLVGGVVGVLVARCRRSGVEPQAKPEAVMSFPDALALLESLTDQERWILLRMWDHPEKRLGTEDQDAFLKKFGAAAWHTAWRGLETAGLIGPGGLTERAEAALAANTNKVMKWEERRKAREEEDERKAPPIPSSPPPAAPPPRIKLRAEVAVSAWARAEWTRLGEPEHWLLEEAWNDPRKQVSAEAEQAFKTKWGIGVWHKTAEGLRKQELAFDFGGRLHLAKKAVTLCSSLTPGPDRGVPA